MIIRKIFHIGDKLEDRVRGKLSHFPFVYALVGGVGVVLFWRGVWHTYDMLFHLIFAPQAVFESSGFPWWDGPVSFALGSSILLATGLFVSSFIGNEIIITGLKGEKKVIEKLMEESSK